MPQPPSSGRPVNRLNRLAVSTGSGAPPDPQNVSEERSRLSRPGECDSAIHMVGTPGRIVARLFSMSPSTASASKRSLQQQLVRRRRTLAQQHHCQRIDVEQRQHADHLVFACRSSVLRPRTSRSYIGDRRGEVGVGQHGALGQPGGAAGILQQRDVARRPAAAMRGNFGVGLGEVRPGDDRRHASAPARSGLAIGPRRSSRTIRRSTCPSSSSPAPSAASTRYRMPPGRGRRNPELVGELALRIERAEQHQACSGLGAPKNSSAQWCTFGHVERQCGTGADALAQQGRRRPRHFAPQLRVGDAAPRIVERDFCGKAATALSKSLRASWLRSARPSRAPADRTLPGERPHAHAGLLLGKRGEGAALVGQPHQQRRRLERGVARA